MKQLIALLLLALPALGEDLFVRPGGPGTGATNWNGAWSSPANIDWGAGDGQAGSGDTVYIGGGTYGIFTVSASGVTIKRASATISACTSAAGWNATNDSMVIIDASDAFGLEGGIAIGHNVTHCTIDGTTNWGIKITNIGASYDYWYGTNGPHVGVKIGTGVAGDNCTITRLEIDGNTLSAKNIDGIGGPSENSGQQNLTVSHCYIHNVCAGAIVSFADPFTFEYNIISDTFSDGLYHGDGVFMDQMEPTYVRFNRFGPNLTTGTIVIFFNPSQGADANGNPQDGYVYGNVFYGSDTWPDDPNTIGAMKCIQWQKNGVGKLPMGDRFYIYNNTFIGYVFSCFQQTIDKDGSVPVLGWTAKNNIFINCMPNEGGTRSYNLYGYGPITATGATDPSYSGTKGDVYKNTAANTYWICAYDGNYWKKINATGGEDSSNEQNTVLATDIFSSYAGNNYTLVAATDAGDPLGSQPLGLTNDMLLVARGGDGVWDRGAYEFNSTPSVPIIQSNNIVGAIGTNFTQYMVASGNPTNWYADNLPSALTINSSGLVSGTVTNAFTNLTVTLRAYNSVGGATQAVLATFYPLSAAMYRSTTTLNFPVTPTNGTAQLSLIISNHTGTQGSTLTGIVHQITDPQFTIVGDTNYNLTGTQTKTITFKFTPTSVATNLAYATLTGDGNKTNTLTAWAAPLITGTNIPLRAALITPPSTTNASGNVYGTVDNNSPDGYAYWFVSAPAAGYYKFAGTFYGTTNTSTDSIFFGFGGNWDIIDMAGNAEGFQPLVTRTNDEIWGGWVTNYNYTNVSAGQILLGVSGRETPVYVTNITWVFTSTGGSDTTPPDTFTFNFPTNSGFTVVAATNYTGIGGTAGDSDGELLAIYWTNATTGVSGTATGTTTWTNYPVNLNVGNNTIYMRAQNTNSLGAVTNIVVNWPGTVAPVSGATLTGGTLKVGQ